MLKELRVAPQVPRRYAGIHIPLAIRGAIQSELVGPVGRHCACYVRVGEIRRRRREDDNGNTLAVPQQDTCGGVDGKGGMASTGVKRQRSIIQALSQVAAQS